MIPSPNDAEIWHPVSEDQQTIRLALVPDAPPPTPPAATLGAVFSAGGVGGDQLPASGPLVVRNVPGSSGRAEREPLKRV